MPTVLLFSIDGVRPDARAADPEIKPAPAPDRRPENGAAEQALPQAEKFNIEPALANPAAQELFGEHRVALTRVHRDQRAA